MTSGCDGFSAIRPTYADVNGADEYVVVAGRQVILRNSGMSDSLAAQIDKHNTYGERYCGWVAKKN